MTLRRKMSLQITAMIVGLMLVAIASLKGFNGLRQNYGAAVEGIQQLREVYEVGSHLATAKTLLPTDQWAAADQVQRALTKVEGAPEWPGEAAPAKRAIRSALVAAREELNMPRAKEKPREEALSRAIMQVRETAYEIRKRVQATEAAAEEKRRTTLISVGLLSGAVILAAVLLGTWQYRGVLSPLQRLSGAVRRVATGQFGVRIVEGGLPSGDDNEFARLAADFNRMADQLDSFYRDLEQKVAAKSKELIRSERLASVGYLAAGVAHEINNPLGIITGYAEYALSEIKNGNPADVDATLRVIRDEAFRCKDITSKLLSMARPGDNKRHRVNLAETAEQVVSVLGGLRDFRDRTITVRAESFEPLLVDAVEGELKQVLMNLLINALEATDDGTGEVKVVIARGHSASGAGAPTVTLSVSDNGRGMSDETLERVFEPFFTERPRDPEGPPPRPGTGLGLSITHAIVQAHRGRISAHSEGLGRGSQFVIELPAAAAIPSEAESESPTGTSRTS